MLLYDDAANDVKLHDIIDTVGILDPLCHVDDVEDDAEADEFDLLLEQENADENAVAGNPTAARDTAVWPLVLPNACSLHVLFPSQAKPATASARTVLMPWSQRHVPAFQLTQRAVGSPKHEQHLTPARNVQGPAALLRVHAVQVDRLPNLGGSPFDGMHIKTSMSAEAMAPLRAECIRWLAVPLGGDALAAELLLLQLLSRCALSCTDHPVAIACGCTIASICRGQVRFQRRDLMKGTCSEGVKPRSSGDESKLSREDGPQVCWCFRWLGPGPHGTQHLQPAVHHSRDARRRVIED